MLKGGGPGDDTPGRGRKDYHHLLQSGETGFQRAAYATSKFAQIGFTQSLALELAPYRINVNAICPGSVDTQRTQDITAVLAPEGKSAQEQYTDYVQLRDSENPLGRIGRTSDIAGMVAFLASSESDYITGESFLVTGGSQFD